MKKVLVTGGSGFLGRQVVSRLQQLGYEVKVPRSAEFNLTDKVQTMKLFDLTEPDGVIHLAALCGGIGINKKLPATFFYDNIMMGVNVLEAARENQVGKLVLIGTVCSYPKFTPIPFKEEDIWNGYPEETNAPYGIAKKTVMEMGVAYSRQHGMNVINLIPVNLYGPGDSLDLEKNHVIPALIKKFVDAKAAGIPTVEVWGTGNASREFLYIDDAADGIVAGFEKHNDPQPVNLGIGGEITIRDLVTTIKNLVGYEGEIVWDTTKPDGQPRRCLDVSRAENLFGFKAKTSFAEGLAKTVEWYRSVKS